LSSTPLIYGLFRAVAAIPPCSTQVAGFYAWLRLGRHVRHGGHGIAIQAPVSKRVGVKDEESGDETVTTGSPSGFRVAYVFDVSQTDGEYRPDMPVSKLEGEDPGRLYSRLFTVAAFLGSTIEEAYLDGRANGYCDHSKFDVPRWVADLLVQLQAAAGEQPRIPSDTIEAHGWLLDARQRYMVRVSSFEAVDDDPPAAARHDAAATALGRSGIPGVGSAPTAARSSVPARQVCRGCPSHPATSDGRPGGESSSSSRFLVVFVAVKRESIE
jgi:hypothetical protein